MMSFSLGIGSNIEKPKGWKEDPNGFKRSSGSRVNQKNSHKKI
jgi:hypothetical protein